MLLIYNIEAMCNLEELKGQMGRRWLPVHHLVSHDTYVLWLTQLR